MDTVPDRALICVVMPEAGCCWLVVSGDVSGELTSRLGGTSFPVDCRDGAPVVGTGVGDAAVVTETLDDLSVFCRPVGGSGGDGRFCMTFIKA